jgi:hypothetical protein
MSVLSEIERARAGQAPGQPAPQPTPQPPTGPGPQPGQPLPPGVVESLHLGVLLTFERYDDGAEASWLLLDDYNTTESTTLTLEECIALRDWLNTLIGAQHHE